MKIITINNDAYHYKFQQLCKENKVTQDEMLKLLMDYYSSPFTGSLELELQKSRLNKNMERNHEKNKNHGR